MARIIKIRRQEPSADPSGPEKQKPQLWRNLDRTDGEPGVTDAACCVLEALSCLPWMVMAALLLAAAAYGLVR